MNIHLKYNSLQSTIRNRGSFKIGLLKADYIEYIVFINNNNMNPKNVIKLSKMSFFRTVGLL